MRDARVCRWSARDRLEVGRACGLRRGSLRARFPLTDGASDYLDIEFKISSSGVHAHQATYVPKIVGEAG